ncbi:MAG TPA: hypothetical protein VFQ53_37430 [Kofleriaceae bacterium]|nr:hypothetical protein [Kofleriaceae bacterium]
MFETTPDNVIARRAGRLAFGIILLAGAGLVVERALRPDLVSLPAGMLLPAAYLLAFASYGAVQLWQRWRRPAPADAATLATAGLVVPGIGLALTLPLALHLPVTLLFGWSMLGFDDWVKLSLVFAGPAHVALAILVAIRGHRLARGSIRTVPSPLFIYVFVVIVSCVPFVVLFGITPAIVAITGIPIVPLIHHMRRIDERERAAVVAGTRLPRAYVASHAA